MVPQKSKPASSLELNTIQTDKFKTELLSVTFTIPQDKLRVPLYGLVLSTLKRGTEKYPTLGDINRRLDDLYGTGISLRLTRYGNNCVLGFTAELLDEAYTNGEVNIFDGALDVILQMLFHPATDENGNFLSKFVESEKSVTCDMIQSKINNPKSYAYARCREIMFGDDDYGASLLGTVDQISSVTTETLTAIYREMLADRKFRAFYVGSKSHERVADLLLSRLRPYLREAATFVPRTDCYVGEERACLRVDEKSDVSQGKLVIGFRTDVNICHEDFYAMLVFSEIFGSSPVSKLFMNVRERLGLCYYCNASYEIYKGVLFVTSGVDPASREEAESEIFRQLDEIRDGHITSAEFDAAIHSLINSYRAISDFPATLESYYDGRDVFALSCTIEECMAGIMRVTPEDVIRVAKGIRVDTVYFLWGDKEQNEEDEDDINDAV